MAFAAAANVLVLVVATPRVGAFGGGLAMVAASLVAGTANIIWLHRHFGIPWRGFYGWSRHDTDQLLAVVRLLTRRIRRVPA
ncbi:hypothetical protein [Nostocoides vanveenii]|jgi:hypothetical protein|uniref:Polysaccharide biosynthesis protein C-terminal domain-containing protein n=1 Tax=Nostocoides vanveenii TaxID=330835 RepID=A0ABN2KNE8_9MICO